MDIWYELMKLIMRCYAMIFIRSFKVTGVDNLIPGPKIIIANHANFTDPFVLPLIISEKLYFLIQSKTFDLPILGQILTKAGQIPVILGHGRDALRSALDRLSEGKVVVIFPEGKLNHGKHLVRAGSGAAVLARKSGAPVLPVGFFVPPAHSKKLKGKIHGGISEAVWQVQGTCFVHFGSSFRLQPTQRREISHSYLRMVTAVMMSRIEILIHNAKDEALKYETTTLQSSPKEIEQTMVT